MCTTTLCCSVRLHTGSVFCFFGSSHFFCVFQNWLLSAPPLRPCQVVSHHASRFSDTFRLSPRQPLLRRISFHPTSAASPTHFLSPHTNRITDAFRFTPRQPLLRRISFHPTPAASPTHCLLYTSQSPRDRTRSRMPSSA